MLIENALNIFTEGSCLPSPRRGGLGIIFIHVDSLGVGPATAIIALSIYSLLPIVSNTLIGLNGVYSAIIEAARGMGMKSYRVLITIELPMAAAMVVAGIRTAVTITIGSAILAAFVGGRGLGNFIIAGNNINRWQVLVLGAVLPVLMILIADVGLKSIEKKASYMQCGN